MKITKEILESTVKEIAKKALPAVVDENFNIEEKEPYELYNAIVGTVFDAAGYNKVATEAPEYLYSHIPGGSKMVGEPKSADITGDEKVDDKDVTAIEELLNKENPTIEDIKTGDVTGDFKLDTHDKKRIEKEAEHQKKSEVDVEEVEPTTEPTEPTEPTVEPTEPAKPVEPTTEEPYTPDLNNLEDAEDAVAAISDAIKNGGMTAETDPGMDLNKDGVIDDKDLKIAQDAVENLKG